MGSGTGKSDSAYKKKNTLGLFIYGRRDGTFVGTGRFSSWVLHENVSTQDNFTRDYLQS